MINSPVNSYWQKFLDSRPDLSHLKDEAPDAWSFGGNADLLLSLVLEGKKTATSSLLSVYNDPSVPMPKANSYSIILNSKGEPKCVVHLFETKIKKFNEMDEQHAYEEGEGDRTLNYWRKVYLGFFSAYPDFTEDSEILCERFKVVY